MEESKRENNKIKRSKSDVKNLVSAYLQKRNYSTYQPFECTQKEQITHSLIENGLSRSNSILFSCYNNDPAVIDQNFNKFLLWLRDQVKQKGKCQDLEPLIGPLFCHFYLEILRGGHSDKAAAFYKCHIASIDKSKCNSMTAELIRLAGSDIEFGDFKTQFRSKKFVFDVSSESFNILKKFVVDCCHIVFLQILQTWFDFKVNCDKEGEEEMEASSFEEKPKDAKFQNLLKAIKDLKKEPQPIYNVKINNPRDTVSTGLLKRQCGLVAYAASNVVNLMTLHSLDNLLHLDNVDHVQLSNHHEKVYALDMSSKNTTLVSVSADHTLCIYDLTEMKLIKKCSGHLGPIYCVKFSTNDAFVATGSMDGTARLWEASTGKLLRVFTGHTQSVISVDFHPNCLYLATGSADKNIRMWCLNKGTSLRLLHAAKGSVYTVAFGPLGKLLASSSEDKKLRIWDLLTSKVVIELRCKDAPLLKVIWNKAGTEVCGASTDGIVKVWDVVKIQENPDSSKYHEPIVTQTVNSRLLSLEYEFGTFGILTV